MANANKVNAERSIAQTGSVGNASQKTEDFASIGVNAATDVFYALKVARGSIITGLKLNAEAGLSAATGTIDIGYVMGADVDDDYFASAFNSVTGGQVVSAAMPLICTADCYIIVTVNTAVTVVDKRMAITAEFEYKGEV